jgi:hypothetical protein
MLLVQDVTAFDLELVYGIEIRLVIEKVISLLMDQSVKSLIDLI